MTKSPAPKKWLTALLKAGGQHSSMGPSSAERVFTCTASLLWCADLPDRETRFAAEGTFAHAVSEYCRIFEVPVEELLGVTVKYPYGEKWDFEIDPEMVEALQGFIDRANAFEGDAYFEKLVHYTDYIVDGWGTADDFRLRDNICKVTDLKYGMGVLVPVENNIQQMLYCLGIYQDYKHLYDFKNFILTIDQPRRDYYSEWKLTLEELLHWVETYAMERAVIATDRDKATFVSDVNTTTGHSHCQFCRGKYICRTRALDIMSINIDRQDITLEELASILPRLPAIKQFCNDMQDWGEKVVADGDRVCAQGELPYKLIQGRRARFFKNPDLLMKLLRKLKITKTDAFTTTELKSVAVLEKMVPKKSLEDFIDFTRGAPRLVPGYHKGMALELKAEEEFSAIKQDVEG